jgi:hypothetical protein
VNLGGRNFSDFSGVNRRNRARDTPLSQVKFLAIASQYFLLDF